MTLLRTSFTSTKEILWHLRSQSPDTEMCAVVGCLGIVTVTGARWYDFGALIPGVVL